MKVGDLVSYNGQPRLRSLAVPVGHEGTGIVINQHKNTIGVYWVMYKQVTAEHKNYLKVISESR